MKNYFKVLLLLTILITAVGSTAPYIMGIRRAKPGTMVFSGDISGEGAAKVFGKAGVFSDGDILLTFSNEAFGNIQGSKGLINISGSYLCDAQIYLRKRILQISHVTSEWAFTITVENFNVAYKNPSEIIITFDGQVSVSYIVIYPEQHSSTLNTGQTTAAFTVYVTRN